MPVLGEEEPAPTKLTSTSIQTWSQRLNVMRLTRANVMCELQTVNGALEPPRPPEQRPVWICATPAL
eukprot:8904688-Lingulodinium_polyedra.AAC.1